MSGLPVKYEMFGPATDDRSVPGAFKARVLIGGVFAYWGPDAPTPEAALREARSLLSQYPPARIHQHDSS